MTMTYDDCCHGYLDLLSQHLKVHESAYGSAVDDMESYDPDEGDYRGAYRAHLLVHPDGEFMECEVAGVQGIW